MRFVLPKFQIIVSGRHPVGELAPQVNLNERDPVMPAAKLLTSGFRLSKRSVNAAGMTFVFLCVMFTILTSKAHAQVCGTPPTNGLVGHWRFDESGNTSTAVDSVGSNNGTLNGFPADPSASWQSGIISNSLDFDGNNQKVNIGNSAAIDPAVWTWCFWAKREGPGDADPWQELLGNGSFQTDGTTFNFEPENTNFTVFVNRAGARDSASVNVGSTDVWRHYCASWDGTYVRVYANGALGDTSVATSMVDSGNNYFIGGNPSANETFDGKMDDVRVYNRVLSEEEIGQIYTAGFSDEGNIIFNETNALMQYCDGTDWRNMGIGSYVPNAISLDGVDDYVEMDGSTLTGSTQFTFSFWVKQGSATTMYRLINDNGDHTQIFLNDDNTVGVFIRDSGGSQIFGCQTGVTALDDTTDWHNFMFSMDSATGDWHLYVDDVAEMPACTFNSANAYQPELELRFGADHYGNFHDVEMADIWYDLGTYIDFSVEANRRKFISEAGMPMYLGADGSIPTGSAPDIFLSGDTANWHINKGTGTGFTENGEITYSSSRPGASLIQEGDIATGLVGYWTLDEASGTFADSSSNSNTGTQSGGVTYGTDGIVNSGAGFDGTDDVILVPNDASLENFTAFTLAAWVYPTAVADSGGSRVISKSDGGTGDNYNLGYANSETSWIRVETDGDVQANINGNVLPLNTWTHLVGTWDGTNMRLYENGVEVSTSPVAKSGVLDADGTQLGIGGHPTAADRFFPGNLDEIRIYDRALSETDIQNLYRGGIPGKIRYNIAYNVMEYFNGAEWVAMGPIGGTPPTSGLVGHWTLDETSGTFADSSGNGNNGTQSGGVTYAQAGVLNNAASFDGTDDTVLITDPGTSSIFDFGASDNITLSVWIKPSSVSGPYQNVFGKNDDPTTTNYMLQIFGDDVAFYYRDFSAQYQEYTVADVLSAGVWQHIAVTHTFGDPSAINIYVNGFAVSGTWNLGTGTTVPVQNNVDISIGGGYLEYVDASLDDARIYNRALSAKEVMQLYQFGLSGGLGDVDNGCTSPARPEGVMLYNQDHNVMQYCNGEEWIRIGQ